jgi:hypothetical protein
MAQVIWGFFAATPDVDSADISEPDDNKKAGGWVFGEQPPHVYMNWILARMARSLLWLTDDPISNFLTLSQALGTDPAGAPNLGTLPDSDAETLVKTNRGNFAVQSRGQLYKTGAPGAAITAIATDGRSIYYIDGINAGAVSTDEPGEPNWEYPNPWSLEWKAVAADGRYVYFGSQLDGTIGRDEIHKLDIIDGSLVESRDQAAEVAMMRADGQWLAVLSSGGGSVQIFEAGDLSAPDSLILFGTATANCCEQGGELTFAGITKGAEAYDVKISRSSDGALMGQIAITSTAGTHAIQDMAYDPGRGILAFVGDEITDGAASYSLWVYSVATKVSGVSTQAGVSTSLIWRASVIGTGSDPTSVCIDDKFVFTNNTNGDLQCRDLATGKLVWLREGDGPSNPRSLRCDGVGVFGSKQGNIEGYMAHPGPRVFARAKSDDANRSPFPNLALPLR